MFTKTTKILDGWVSLGYSNIDQVTLTIDPTPTETLEYDYNRGLVRWQDQQNLGDPGPYTFTFDRTEEPSRRELLQELTRIYSDYMQSLTPEWRALKEWLMYERSLETPIHQGINYCAARYLAAKNAPTTTWDGTITFESVVYDVTTNTGLQDYLTARGEYWETKLWVVEGDYNEARIYIQTAPMNAALIAFNQFNSKYGSS